MIKCFECFKPILGMIFDMFFFDLFKIFETKLELFFSHLLICTWTSIEVIA